MAFCDTLCMPGRVLEKISLFSFHCLGVLFVDHQKTSSEKIRESSLLQELLDTVSQRNLIVDSIEEDRIR